MSSINESFEWGQVFLLDLLVEFENATSADAELIIDRILPRLTHINPSIVFSTVKTIISFFRLLNEPVRNALAVKLTQPISSLPN